MKAIIKKLSFYLEYYFGYFMYSGSNRYKWSNYIINKYPEEFPQEIKYLRQLQETNKTR